MRRLKTNTTGIGVYKPVCRRLPSDWTYDSIDGVMFVIGEGDQDLYVESIEGSNLKDDGFKPYKFVIYRELTKQWVSFEYDPTDPFTDAKWYASSGDSGTIDWNTYSPDFVESGWAYSPGCEGEPVAKALIDLIMKSYNEMFDDVKIMIEYAPLMSSAEL